MPELISIIPQLIERKHGKNERSAAAEASNYLCVRKIASLCDRSIIFCRRRTHYGTKNRTIFGILRPA